MVLQATSHRPPKHIRYANKVNQAYKEFVLRKYELSPSMEGGSLMENIQMISLFFRTHGKHYSVEDARSLMITCIKEYLERINTNKDIKPYLCVFPFTAENLEFQINFYKEPLLRVEKGYVSTVGVVKGKVYYLTFDHEKGKSEDLFHESYEEAVRIVEGGHPRGNITTYDATRTQR